METNKIKYNVIILILIIIIGGFVYALMFKPAGGVIDTSHYEKTVDSLNVEINKHNIRVDSLTASIGERNKKIDQYSIELGKLKNKLHKEKKAHEANINRINAMSNADIASEFTNAFE
jgi:short subunit fatty acids transporter